METLRPRICFVIMPFSQTASCTEDEWTKVFETIFKPAIENAGLGYECRRSVATRGNIVGGILRDLNDAHVILADLTDRNANVFYELGVRHALTNRTIIVAQRREHIPFDLQSYASHVYNWKSEAGKHDFASTIKRVLEEIDVNPERPDNPVSDFLQGIERPIFFPEISPETSVEIVQPVQQKPKSLRAEGRLVLSKLEDLVTKLNQQAVPGSVPTNDIPKVASEFTSAGEPLLPDVEVLALTAVQNADKEAIDQAIALAGDLMTLSGKPRDGRNVRFATGLPTLFAWRMLILMGSKAIEAKNYGVVESIIKQPIEVEQLGRFSSRALLYRSDLFYAEAFLGYPGTKLIEL